MATTLPTPYQQFIHKSRYARWIEDEARRETWEETVDRYVNHMCDEQCAGKIPDDVRQQIRDSILGLRVMPSMRCMMTAGKALARDQVAGYNCFAGDTLVTTREYGIIAIRELAGKDVHIVDGNGEWVVARCRSYGSRGIYEVSVPVSGNGKDMVFRCTGNHDWLLRKDGSRVKTVDLKPGDKLLNGKMPERPVVDDDSDDFAQGVRHGIIYGDGTRQMKNHSLNGSIVQKVCKGFTIRLCEDWEEYLKFFGGFPVSYPESYGGQPVVYLFGLAIDQKELPEVDDGFFTDEYLTGFIRGWIAADGSVGKTGQVSLAANEEGLAWLYKVGPALGFVPRGHRGYPERTNLSDRKEKLFHVELDRRYLVANDLLISRKRERFKYIRDCDFGTVKSVVDTGVEEEVFCFDVPTTHSFLLTRNVLTGNCSYVAIDDPKAFDEMLYILMCGTGVGFSVERQFINKMPTVAERLRPSKTVIGVEDSKLGWANAYRELVSMLYQGRIPKWNVDEVREKGARLKTFGGRASGPDPLVDLFNFTVEVFKGAEGRRLNSIECHDICCKIGEIVIVGGVRRSALISLSNPSDDRMRHAKDGNWVDLTPWRGLANNSACYTEKPGMDVFFREWLALFDSKSGERGIFNREAVTRWAEKGGRRDPNYEFGTNPCSEIVLRSCGFCNLSEVVIRAEDTIETLKEKVRVATIIGTMQATLVDFRYLREIWRTNAEEEALLGVSLTGIMDNELMSGKKGKKELVAALEELRDYAIEVNAEWAERLGVNPAAAITCVKPSGTVSQLVDCASGIHPRYARHYVRRVRATQTDPVAVLMAHLGIPMEADVKKPKSIVVFSFPVRAPDDAVISDDLSSLDHLELWKTYQLHWCEHKPSITVRLREHEWMEAGAWVYRNFDIVSGISFLPHSGHTYQQPPYEECTEEEYMELLEQMPDEYDWSQLCKFEKEDRTMGTQIFACLGKDSCDVADIIRPEDQE